MKLNRTKTYIKNRLEKSSEKLTENTSNAKISPMKLISKVSPSPLKLKKEIRKKDSDNNDNSPIKLRETIPNNEESIKGKSKFILFIDLKDKLEEGEQHSILLK